jgi:hypothetical protein
MIIGDLQTAKSVPFDNSTNGFTATECQSAIEEARNDARVFQRTTLVLQYNATVQDGNYITYSDLLSNKRIPWANLVELKDFTWVNSSFNLGAFTFKFYKNGTAEGNLIYTYYPLSQDLVDGLGIHNFATVLTLQPRDYIYVKHNRASGTALQDLGIALGSIRIPE